MSIDSSGRHGTHHDAIRASGLSFESLAELEGDRLRVQTVRYAAPEPTSVAGSGETLLTLHEAGSVDVERWGATGRSVQLGGLGLTTITSAEHDYTWRFDEVTVTHLCLPLAVTESLAETLDESDRPFELLDPAGVDDDFMRRLVPMIRHETRHGEALSELFVDGFEQLLAGHLLRRYSSHAQAFAKRMEGSDARPDAAVIVRAQRYLEENSERNVTLTEVADHVGLSTFHFSRAFKARTGFAPYRYLLECRLRRAQERLAATDESLVDIAQHCGYSSQAHMTASFSRYLGVTPARYRKLERC